MHFERRIRLSKCIKLKKFPEKKIKKKLFVPTLPKILDPLPKTHFFIWPNKNFDTLYVLSSEMETRVDL